MNQYFRMSAWITLNLGLAISLSACKGTVIGTAVEGAIAPQSISTKNDPTNPRNLVLPSDFSSDIPIYPQATLQSIEVGSGTLAASQNIFARWTSVDDVNKVSSFYEDAFAKQEASMDLKARLQTFVELSEAMDWAVADQESTRTEDEPVWLIALHGRIAELRLDDQTLAYIDAPGERLAFEVALAGDNPQPTPTQKTIPRPRASVAFLISHIARYCVLCIQRRSSSVSKASCLGSTLMLARNQSPPCGFGDFSGRARQLPQYLCFGSCQLRNRQKPRLRLTAICVRQCFEC